MKNDFTKDEIKFKKMFQGQDNLMLEKKTFDKIMNQVKMSVERKHIPTVSVFESNFSFLYGHTRAIFAGAFLFMFILGGYITQRNSNSIDGITSSLQNSVFSESRQEDYVYTQSNVDSLIMTDYGLSDTQ
ncbi:MAG: hypothetical protein WCK48_01945 [bacterium]